MGTEERQVRITDTARPQWRRVLSRAVRLVRASVERTLHASRRRRAAGFLYAQRSTLQSVLFVCEGNIYRSPFAAACLAAFRNEHRERPLRVGSAGFVGPNGASPHDAQHAARRYGIDLSAHRSQLLNGGMLVDWELIVVMEAGQATRIAKRFGFPRSRILVLGDFDPGRIDRRSIADPWSDPPKLLLGSYARVERCVRVVAALLGLTATRRATSSVVDSSPA
jgi:protein-tyrosine phosphatase